MMFSNLYIGKIYYGFRFFPFFVRDCVDAGSLAKNCWLKYNKNWLQINDFEITVGKLYTAIHKFNPNGRYRCRAPLRIF